VIIAVWAVGMIILVIVAFAMDRREDEQGTSNPHDTFSLATDGPRAWSAPLWSAASAAGPVPSERMSAATSSA
jgi:hypothetical protein